MNVTRRAPPIRPPTQIEIFAMCIYISYVRNELTDPMKDMANQCFGRFWLNHIEAMLFDKERLIEKIKRLSKRKDYSTAEIGTMMARVNIKAVRIRAD